MASSFLCQAGPSSLDQQQAWEYRKQVVLFLGPLLISSRAQGGNTSHSGPSSGQKEQPNGGLKAGRGGRDSPLEDLGKARGILLQHIWPAAGKWPQGTLSRSLREVTLHLDSWCAGGAVPGVTALWCWHPAGSLDGLWGC